MRREREVRVAPCIYKVFSANGYQVAWRVYVRRQDPRTGRSVLAPKRFKADVTLEDLEIFLETVKFETKRQRIERRRRGFEEARAAAGLFATDARAYLELAIVKAMPSYAARKWEIEMWVEAFGRLHRRAITSGMIDEQLQAWRNAGKAAGTCNKRRSSLMAMFTRLDGRGVVNPVKDTKVFEEPAAEPRGIPYDLVKRILDAIPSERSRPIPGEKGYMSAGSKTRVRLELMAWTGMTPAQIGALTPAHVNLRERWYISPTRKKGARRARTPRPLVKKPMTRDAHAAFTQLAKLPAFGRFSAASLRHSFERAVEKVQVELRQERQDPEFELRVRPYDLRHSFGTELYRRTGNLVLVSEMLDHSSLAMTKRYALGAVSDVLKDGLRQFERAAGRRHLRSVS